MDFPNLPQTFAGAGFTRFGQVPLPWELGAVTVGLGCRYRGAFGLLISHLPLAYSLTVQPTAASSANALRAV